MHVLRRFKLFGQSQNWKLEKKKQIKLNITTYQMQQIANV